MENEKMMKEEIDEETKEEMKRLAVTISALIGEHDLPPNLFIRLIIFQIYGHEVSEKSLRNLIESSPHIIDEKNGKEI